MSALVLHDARVRGESVTAVDRAPRMTAHIAQQAALRMDSGTATRGCGVRLLDEFDPLRSSKPVAPSQMSPECELVCTVGCR
jgi:hypothetical protein